MISGAVWAQDQAKVDFGRDVQPLLRQHCVGCHGPSQQMNGLRLDRRREAMRGGTLGAVIGPGNAGASRLYVRVSGSLFGPQMPPTGPLSAEHIQTIKAWIDQGAPWPDELSGETPASPPDPRATGLMSALRAGDRERFRKRLAADPGAAMLKGPDGITPLMYAALYGDVASLRALLDSGADPNVRNDAGVTALMWAVNDVEKTRLLLDRGADVNVRSADGRTPLFIAAARYGSSGVLKLLLDRGAKPNVKALSLFGDATPLAEAVYAGDEAAARLLLQHGADPKIGGYVPMTLASQSGCAECLDVLLAASEPAALNVAMLLTAPPLGDASTVKRFLDRGAEVNAKDSAGQTILMKAASSDTLPVDLVKRLIARGADVNAKSLAGETALGLAKQRGQTAMVDLLVKAGAHDGPPPAPPASARPSPAPSVRAAVERSLPLLQRTDVVFMQKSGCVSCHNNTLTAMTIAAARRNGVRVDDHIAGRQHTAIASFLESWRERVLQGIGIPGDADTVSYILTGLAAEHHQPDAATDAMARYLKHRQLADGRWRILAHRPPLESHDIEVTATSLRALAVYAPHADRAEYVRAVRRGADWLMKAEAPVTEARAFKVLGLTWAGASRAAIQKEARALAAIQRPDGGWAQLPSLASDAYATGQALVALKESGARDVSDPVYARGVQFLINSQFDDGSWMVKTRALPIQPLFDIGFPHGKDSWISAAATNWAATALAYAVGPK